MTFNKWLKRQDKRDDPVGDLARDAARDPRPVPSNTNRAWDHYLWVNGASVEAMRAFDQAWREYQVDQ